MSPAQPASVETIAFMPHSPLPPAGRYACLETLTENYGSDGKDIDLTAVIS